MSHSQTMPRKIKISDNLSKWRINTIIKHQFRDTRSSRDSNLIIHPHERHKSTLRKFNLNFSRISSRFSAFKRRAEKISCASLTLNPIQISPEVTTKSLHYHIKINIEQIRTETRQTDGEGSPLKSRSVLRNHYATLFPNPVIVK